MTWIKGLPKKEGRYFFRTADHYYGICLVAWDKGHAWGADVQQPQLEVKGVCNFGCRHPEKWKNEGTGENTDYPGWSYGSMNLEEAADALFLPADCPEDFAPINGRPPDIPAEKIAASKAAEAKKKKKNKASDRKEAKRRKKIIQTAVDEGVSLYQCDDCENTWHEEELEVGKLRECPHCSTTFVAEDRNCPDCNRPFTRVEEEKTTCPNCISGGELPDLTILVKDGVEQK